MDHRWLLAAGVAVLSVGAGIWWGADVYGDRRHPPPNPLETAVGSGAGDSPISSSVPPNVVVHVGGWVSKPGMVTVPDGGRVGDAIAAAGGAVPGANLEGLNLATVVGDGQLIIVPGPDGPTTGQSPVSDGAGAAGSGLVDINTAPATELERLPGVGPVLAERIVSHREANGPFEAVEDLLEVSGIGESKLESIREQATTR